MKYANFIKMRLAGLGSFVFAFWLSACSLDSNDPEDSVLLRIGPSYLTKTEMESRILEVGLDYVPYFKSDEGKRALFKAIIRSKLLASQARRLGLDRDKSFKEDLRRTKREQQRALRLYQEALLAKGLIERLRQKELKVTDEEIQNYYKEHRHFYHVRHILVTSLEQAEKLRKQLYLKKSVTAEEFGRLAQAHSLEASSARNGGKIPPFLAGELEETFEQPLRALKPGELSPAVRTDFGWHLIFLEKVTPAPNSDEVKGRIANIVEKKRLESLIALWKSKYRLEVKDDSIRPYLTF